MFGINFYRNLGIIETASIGCEELLWQKNSSSDNCLFPLFFVDVFALLKQYESVSKLLVTGDVKKNSSLGWFNAYCEIKGVKLNLEELNNKTQCSTVIYPDGKRIEVYKAISTSGAAYHKADEEVAASIMAGLDLIRG